MYRLAALDKQYRGHDEDVKLLREVGALLRVDLAELTRHGMRRQEGSERKTKGRRRGDSEEWGRRRGGRGVLGAASLEKHAVIEPRVRLSSVARAACTRHDHVQYSCHKTS